VYGFLVSPNLAPQPHFTTPNHQLNLSSHAFTALKVQIDILWVLTPFTYVAYHGRFGGNAASTLKIERTVFVYTLDTPSLSLHIGSVRSYKMAA